MFVDPLRIGLLLDELNIHTYPFLIRTKSENHTVTDGGPGECYDSVADEESPYLVAKIRRSE